MSERTAPRFRRLPRAAALSSVVWLIACMVQQTWLPHALLGFALLGPLPLGMALSLHGGGGKPSDKSVPFSYRMLLLLLPGLLLGGFVLFQGPAGNLPAAMGCGAVSLFCLWLALSALGRLWRRGPRPLHELAIDAGLVAAFVGSIWLFASRLGTGLFGYGEPNVLLSAEHMYLAGFGALVWLGALGRHVPAPRLKRYHAATGATLLGLPMVGLGIATVRPLEWLGVVLFLGGLVFASAHAVQVALRVRAQQPLACAALLGSSLSLWGSSVLALGWAFTGHGGKPLAGSAWLDLDGMLQWHGSLNAVGFVGLGLLALTLLEQPHGR